MIKNAKDTEETAPNSAGDYLKNIAITAAAHRAVDSAATYGVRRTGLFKNYYANAAKEGINAALSGEDLMPRWRRTLGIVSPSLTGLTDYEVARGLTHKLMHEINMPVGKVKNLEALTQNGAVYNAMHQVIKNRLNATHLSPITKNIANALDPELQKNKVIEFLRTHGGMGKDQQKNPWIYGGMLTALTGLPHGLTGAAGALASNSVDLTLSGMAQNANLTKNIEDAKLGIIGLGAVTSEENPVKSNLVGTGLNLLSPSTGEIYDMGQDLGKATHLLGDQKPLVKQIIQQKLIAPGTRAPSEAASNILKDLTWSPPKPRAPSAAASNILNDLTSWGKNVIKHAADCTPEQLKEIEQTFYHGSPKANLRTLAPGSYVTPDLETAKLMGRFHTDTGKTWSDDDLIKKHYFGNQPKWKPGKEPTGDATIYKLRAAIKQLNLLNNPYEHITLEKLPIEKLSAAFNPDYTPEDLQRMGVYEEVYDRTKPRLASLNRWPEHWFHPEDKMGWLEWYKKYNQGRRMEDDNRQIRRWAAFKARHGGKAFQENPTPRRAYALRNWGIDPTRLITNDKKRAALEQAMASYKDKRYKKAAVLLKQATTFGATRALLNELKAQGGKLYKNPRNMGQELIDYYSRTMPASKFKFDGSLDLYESLVSLLGPMALDNKAVFVPRGKQPLPNGSFVSPRHSFFHEMGHSMHANDDPAYGALLSNAGLTQSSNTAQLNTHLNKLTTENIANNNAVNFMKANNVPQQNIVNYLKETGPAYKTYLDAYRQTLAGSGKLSKDNFRKTLKAQGISNSPVTVTI
jgi:hypothetical protein